MFNGKIHYKWSFSIAMLNYQRVDLRVDPTKPSSITSPPRSKDGPDGPVAASGRLREVWKIVVQHKVGTVGRHVGSEFNEFQ